MLEEDTIKMLGGINIMRLEKNTIRILEKNRIRILGKDTIKILERILSEYFKIRIENYTIKYTLQDNKSES